MTAPLDEKAEHPRIWLEPAGAPDRCWCSDNQWGDEGVQYILASETLSAVALPDELEGRLKPNAVVDHVPGLAVSNLRRVGSDDLAERLNQWIVQNNALKAEAHSTLAALRAERDKAIRSRAHAVQWYAERLRKIEDVAKREGIWPEVAAIIANGSGTRQLQDGSFVYDPPTYAQQLNSAKHRAETAEAEVKRLTEALNEIRELNMSAEDENGHRWANSDLIEQTIVFAMAGARKAMEGGE